MTQTIPLGLTAPPLTKNQRLHHMAVYRKRKELRERTALLARHAKATPVDPAAVTLHWRPKVRRLRDEDNAFDTLKPCLDGLVDAGVLPHGDDSGHVTARVHIHQPVPGKPGALWLTVEEWRFICDACGDDLLIDQRSTCTHAETCESCEFDHRCKECAADRREEGS